jgi:hypothetical protein
MHSSSLLYNLSISYSQSDTLSCRYYHELFLSGRMDLCKLMSRTRIKGNGSKAASSPATEPNFYLMESCHSKESASRDEKSGFLREGLNMILDEIPDIKETDEVLVSEMLSNEDIALLPQDETSETVLMQSCITRTPSTTPPLSSTLDDAIDVPPINLSFSVVSPERTTSRPIVTPPHSPQLLASLSIPIERPSPLDMIHSGDKILFEGLPFHYLETKDIEDSLLQVEEV